jgi:hypothetical protein
MILGIDERWEILITSPSYWSLRNRTYFPLDQNKQIRDFQFYLINADNNTNFEQNDGAGKLGL